jgi:endonuclease III
MLCSSVIPDERLVPAMKSLFTKYDVTPEFVLLKHEEDCHYWENTLRGLGRQNMNARNIILAAQTTLSLKRIPRNYTKLVMNYKGVGPKIALVTMHSAYGKVVRSYVSDFVQELL